MPRISTAQRRGLMTKQLAINLPLNTISVVMLGSQILNAAGIVLNQSAGGFLIGLYFALLTSGGNFLFLLWVIGRAQHGTTP